MALLRKPYDGRKHKLVVHFLDGRILKGTTYKLDPQSTGFYLIPFGHSVVKEEVFVKFADVKAVFYVKDFEGLPMIEKGMEEYIPEGHEITVEFVDGEVIKGFALAYSESSDTFYIDISDPDDNSYVVLVNRSAVNDIKLGKKFRTRKLQTLLDTPVKMLILRYYWDNPEDTISLEELAEKIGRTVKIVKRDINVFINEGLMEWVPGPSQERVTFLPIYDDEVKQFIEGNLSRLRRLK